jgi:hypothetical protein
MEMNQETATEASQLARETADDDIEEQTDHDQLPSVEEAKFNLSLKPAGRFDRRRKLLLVLAGVLAVAGLAVSAILISKNSENKNKRMATEPQSRLEDTIFFLFDQKVSNLPDLSDPRTPQHRAAQFLADGDLYSMALSVDSPERFIERYVLTLLYYHFNGPEWNYQLRFLSGLDHCNWNQGFTTTSGMTLREGVICNEDGEVTELNLCKSFRAAHLVRSTPPRIRFISLCKNLFLSAIFCSMEWPQRQ